MAFLYDSGIHSIIGSGSAIGVGWTITFYTSGTTTERDTYPTAEDAAAGTNPNPNPIVIGADGRVPAVWVSDPNYKAILKDAAGVVKSTRDPCIGGGQDYQQFRHIVLSQNGDIGNLGDFNGTTLGSYLQINGGPVGLDTQSCGMQLLVWGNHSKGATDYVGKSRGADVGDFAACVTGDTIYRKFIQASGVSPQFGHVGIEGWQVDATPTNGGEVAGRFYISTDTGLHISEAPPSRPTYYGLKQALVINRKQQAYFPGVISIPTDAGTTFGGIVHIGACGENAGEANLFFDLTSAVLMTTPVAGAYEVDANGRHYITDSNAKRDAVLVGQVKVGGDSGAVAAGAAAGTGPTISVVWGNGCARVTLTTGTTPGTGTLFTLTYPHTFSTQSFAFLQAGNANAVGVVGSKLYTTSGTSNVVVSAGVALSASTAHIFDVFFTGN